MGTTSPDTPELPNKGPIPGLRDVNAPAWTEEEREKIAEEKSRHPSTDQEALRLKGIGPVQPTPEDFEQIEEGSDG
jgi:hypothetical protein